MITKVFTFLLIVYLCYRLIRFFFRPLLAIFAKRAFKKAAERQGYGRKPPRQPDGSIRIEHMPPKNNKQQQTEFKGGEYVDYEEIDKRKYKK